MATDSRIENWVSSYKALAEAVLQKHVNAIVEEFPDERFPVRPPYRRSMYQHLLQMVDELNQKMDELLEESPDETDAPLKEQLMALQESYERRFALETQKNCPPPTEEA